MGYINGFLYGLGIAAVLIILSWILEVISSFNQSRDWKRIDEEQAERINNYRRGCAVDKAVDTAHPKSLSGHVQ